MKNKLLTFLKSLSGLVMMLSIITIASTVQAQLNSYYNPYYNPYISNLFFPYLYCPFFPPPPLSYTSPLMANGRYAHAPITSGLFPAPTLPLVPAPTTGGVGVTTLIPTVPVTLNVPASALVINPLAGLITFTPLSLIGLTFAPVPVTTTPTLIFPVI